MDRYAESMAATLENVNIDGTSIDSLDLDFQECQTIEEQLDWLFVNLFGVK